MKNMRAVTPYVRKFAALGFLVGVALAIFAFTMPRIASELQGLFLILCPASFALSVDPKTALEGMIIWFEVCCINAGLYAVVGALLQWGEPRK